MNEKNKCPKCGATIADEWKHELCPACLMQAGFATGDSAQSSPPVRASDETKPSENTFTPPPNAPLSIEEVRKLFPHLEIIEQIGKGGMGVVYKARQPQLDRMVALKLLPAELAKTPGFSERFGREARALAKLNHPNIVSIFDFGQTRSGDTPVAGTSGDKSVAPPCFFLIMEFVDGANLRQMIAAKQIAPELALTIVPKVCEALQFAHDEGILHRDIKPENILIDKKGRVKIADFGLAKLVDDQTVDHALTGTHQVMGTPRYMAPEQFENTKGVDHRADIYSLGVVFYEMLTGEIPMGRFAPPSQKVQVDVRIDEVVLRSLEREPAQRYQHVSEIKTDVDHITQHGAKGDAGIAARAVETGTAGKDARVTLPPLPVVAPELREKIKGAGILMLIAGIAIALSGFIAFIYGAVTAIRYAATVTNPDDYVAARAAGGAFAMIALTLCGIAVIIGGVSMRKLRFHGYAHAMSIFLMALLPVTFLLAGRIHQVEPLFFQLAFGLYAGIKAFRLLRKPEVEAAFVSGGFPTSGTSGDVNFQSLEKKQRGGVAFIIAGIAITLGAFAAFYLGACNFAVYSNSKGLALFIALVSVVFFSAGLATILVGFFKRQVSDDASRLRAWQTAIAVAGFTAAGVMLLWGFGANFTGPGVPPRTDMLVWLPYAFALIGSVVLLCRQPAARPSGIPPELVLAALGAAIAGLPWRGLEHLIPNPWSMAVGSAWQSSEGAMFSLVYLALGIFLLITGGKNARSILRPILTFATGLIAIGLIWHFVKHPPPSNAPGGYGYMDHRFNTIYPSMIYQSVFMVAVITAFLTTLVGAIQMRNHTSEVSDAVLPAPSSDEPRLSRCALIGVIWAPCVLTSWWAWQHCVRQYFDRPDVFASYDAAYLALGITAAILALTAPFGATILGGVAIAKIKRSGGKLYGLPLAAAALLFQPLVALALFTAYLLKPHALFYWFDGGRNMSPNEIAGMREKLGDALSFSRFDIFVILLVCCLAGFFAWRKIAGEKVPTTGNSGGANFQSLENKGETGIPARQESPAAPPNHLNNFLGFFMTPQPGYAKAVGIPAIILTGLWMLVMLVVTFTVPQSNEGTHMITMAAGYLGIPVALLFLHLRWAVTRGKTQSPPLPAKPRGFLGLPVWGLCVATALLGLAAVYLPKPGDLPVPKDAANLFHPVVLVAPEGESYRLVSLQDHKKFTPVFSMTTVNTAQQIVTREFGMDRQRGASLGFFHRSATWNYRLTATRFGDWSGPSDGPLEIAPAEIAKLRPLVVAELNRRKLGGGQLLVEVLETGRHVESVVCWQNAVVLAAWISAVLLVFALAKFLFTTRAGRITLLVIGIVFVMGSILLVGFWSPRLRPMVEATGDQMPHLTASLGDITDGYGVEYTVPAGQVAIFEIVTQRDGKYVPVPPHCAFVMAPADTAVDGTFRWSRANQTGNGKRWRIEIVSGAGSAATGGLLLADDLDAATGASALTLGKLTPNEETIHGSGKVQLRITTTAHNSKTGGSGVASTNWRQPKVPTTGTSGGPELQ